MKTASRVIRNPPWTGSGARYLLTKERSPGYRQVAGGMVFPAGEKPGFAVVVAEDRKEDLRTKLLHRWLLAEIEEHDGGKLIEKSLELEKIHKVQSWYGGFNNAHTLQLLEDFNRDQRKQCKMTLYTLPPPCPYDSLCSKFYVDLIEKHLKNGTLHFNWCNKVRQSVCDLDLVMSGQDISDYPPIAALAYALASLEICHPGSIGTKRVQQKPTRLLAV